MIAFLWLPASACQQPDSVLRILSYRDPFFPEPLEVGFSNCRYAETGGSDRHIVAEAIETLGESRSNAVRHLLHLHVFWRPRPGRTFADPSLTDATARYVIVSREATVVYTGSAFVYLKPQRDGRMRCEIEGGALRLETVDGKPPVPIGDAKLSGTLFAQLDPNRTTELRRLVDLYAAGSYRIEDPGSHRADAGERDAPPLPADSAPADEPAGSESTMRP